jgi:hypothetical protein
VKSSYYFTATVLQGNKIEIQNPHLVEGQTVEIVIIISQPAIPTPDEEQSISLEKRQAFLKLPLAERRRILENQAEIMVSHYQQNSDWQELMAGDIIEY